MPCLVNVLGKFQGTWDQPDKNPGALFRCKADILLNISNCEIQRPGMLMARKIDQVSLVGSTNDGHNCCSARKLISGIPPPIARVQLAVDSTTLRVSQAHRFKIEVRLKWEMCQQELDTFENIPVE
jgi:hypothetical protein